MATNLQDGAARIEVTAPTPTPYRYGFFSVATPSPEVDDRWSGGGIKWVSEFCTTPGITYNVCVDPDVAALEFDAGCVISEFDPFTLYASVGDSVGKFRVTDEAITLARTRLEAGEQYGVEEQMWALLAAGEPSPVAATTLALGLAIVEQALAEAYPSLGVIHMSRLAATLYADQLRVEGNRLVTTLGTPVIAGGGYGAISGAEPSTITVYGTGPVVLKRTAIDDRIRAIHRESNTHNIIAQRTYAIGYDCAVVGATVTV